MKLKAMKKVFALVLACMMLIPALAGIGSFAGETPTVEIVSNNVWYGETLNLMYAIKAENAEGYTFEVTANGEAVGTYFNGKEEIEGVECDVYIVTKGVAAQNIDTVYTATVTCGSVSDTTTYSVLEYLNERLYVTEGVTDLQKETYTALRTYAEKADALLNEDNSIANSVYVTVEDGATGMYAIGSTITATTTKTPDEGKQFVWEIKNDLGELLATKTLDEMAAGIEVTGITFITLAQVDAEVKIFTIPEVLASAEGTSVVVKGTVCEIYQAWNDTYNNISFYISDADGNKLLVFRTGTKVSVGDEVTVTGTATLYYDVIQIAAGSETVIDVAHVCSDFTDADCLNPAKCTVCGKENGEAAGHNYVDGTCTSCGAAEAPSEGLSNATITFDDTAKRTERTTSIQVWEENGIKVTNNKASSTSNVADYVKPARFYKSSELIVEGAGMTTIVFDCNSGSYATALKNSIGTVTGATVTVSSDKVTVVLSAAVDSFTVTLTGGQVRMDGITVNP